MHVLVVIPTYNEIENVEAIVRAVLGLPTTHRIDVLIVDDNSPDGTARATQDLMEEFEHRLVLLERPCKEGLGTAYAAGFAWALERDYDAICEMDADFSHDPRYLPTILEALGRFDFVVGSRYISGGGVSGWGPIRKIISRGGSIYAKSILHCPLYDMTGGFNCWRRSVLEAFDLTSLTSAGYCFQIELKYRALRMGYTGTEVPILFEDRKRGSSKMTKKIVFEAMWKVWSLKYGRNARSS